jgi:hypothetical protein
MKKALGISAFLLLWTTLLFAQAKFTATATKTTVGMGEPFEVDYVINANGERFVAPNFDGFQVVSGPNLSTMESMVNGVSTFSNTYSFILVASKESTYTIGSAAISVNGHTLLSNSLRIKVKGQASPQAQQQAQQQMMQIPDPFADDNSKNSQPPVDTKDLPKNVFLRAEADKTHAYVGEQIKVSYKLYTRLDIAGGQVDKAPDLNGFWNQDIQPPVGQKPSWTTENIGGKKFAVTTIKQSIVFPQHAGELTIDPLSMVMVLQIPVKSLFDSPFGDFRQIKYAVKSTPVTIHAVPLPTAGKPANFTGAVGNFSVYSDVDKTHLKANETLNYTFEVSGKGNLNLINAPTITPPPDFDKYDPKTTDHVVVDQSGVSGSRQFAYLLMPRHQGDYTLTPVGSFSYFNPATNKYVTIPAKSFNIKVDKGDQSGAAMTVFNSSDQQDVKTLGKDIRYIKTSSPDIYKNGAGFFGSVGYYLLFLLGPLAFGGALYYRSWSNKRNSDIVQVKSRKATKVAARHLAQAHAELATGNKTAFYEAVARGLYGYLSDKLNIPVSDLNRENIEEKMKARSINEHTIKQLTETMDLCEMARFAPVSGISQEEVLEKAKNIINEIEEKI